MKTIFTGFLVGLVILLGVVACDKTSTRAEADTSIGTINDWGVYRFIDNQQGVVCYAIHGRNTLSCVKVK